MSPDRPNHRTASDTWGTTIPTYDAPPLGPSKQSVQWGRRVNNSRAHADAPETSSTGPGNHGYFQMWIERDISAQYFLNFETGCHVD
mmetsp:Transcript_56957/g.68178  ORF Transcript_56957/g.68178 Transcript_56957/m.68178 type:complete len:87 (+) Transcript_56957:997-1257(+)|eukprot:CAMPEP_0172492502 /NCGR_PEP_ID=MMETSP1066-20121228/23687_1 /TAXON_ID=671091 /ORGANISM="Coscinodiscus wailesii, Strain CCMP2513" /LENGTH=86 /DNA_ID=CAMNT_0013262173 /DNA_START=997 /DNA_END=1257 /DNA_ORIENTATION=-